MTPHAPSRNPVQKMALAMSILMLVPGLLALVPVSADSGDGTVTTFTGGTGAMAVELNGTGYSTTATIDSPRNVTYQSASLEISYNDDDPSPGKLWLDIDEDGAEEWAWNGSAMGSVGLQEFFSNGAVSESIAVNAGTTTSMGFHLPGAASVATSLINATFTPELTHGFDSIGAVMALEVADLDGDGLDEVVVLSDEPDGNSSANRSIGWLNWDAANSMMSSVTWFETCASGSEIRFGDVNNDSLLDIGVVDLESSSMCLHMSDLNRTGYNSSFDNVSLQNSALDAHIADMNGDGFGDIISLHLMGDLSLRAYRNSTSDWADNETKVIESNSSMGMPAQVSEITVGQLNGSGTKWSAIVSDGEEFVGTYIWDTTNGQWFGPDSSFDGIKNNIIAEDIDGDGYLEIIGGTDFGHSVASWNGTAWTVSSGGMMNMINGTLGDADLDGNLDFVTPETGIADGSDVTFVGELIVRPLNTSAIGNQSSTTFEPVTAPTHVRLSDLDGDGVSEHIVTGGESNPGIFIAGWHTFSIDVDRDGSSDGNATGYAGNGSAGVAPLNWSDLENNLKNAIDSIQPSAVMAQDLWHNDYFTVTSDVSAVGKGTVILKDMNISYDATFMVDVNPYASGNLSNVLNQQMELGTGNFSIAFSMNSTQAGKVTLKNLAATYIAGAPHLELPPTPTLNLVSLDESNVELSWDDSLVFGDSFNMFQVFRIVNGTELDLAIHELQMTPLNMTTDSSVSPGVTYDYFVRSLHDFGVASNLSNALTVSVPYPDMIPSINTTVSDRADDEGGWLLVEWEMTVVSTLDHFDIYVSSTQFDNVSGMTPVTSVGISILEVAVNTSSEGEIIDGVPYWACAVPVDVHDRFITDVDAGGPAMSRNDSEQESLLVVALTDGVEVSDGSTPLTVSRGSSLQATVSLSSQGMFLQNTAVSLSMSNSEDSWNTTFQGQTDQAGAWVAIDVQDVDELFGSSEVIGTVTMTVSYAGSEGDASNQPISATVGTAELDVRVDATLTADSIEVRVDDDGNSEGAFSLLTTSTAEQEAVSQGVTVGFEAFNETSGDSDSGTATISDTGAIDITTAGLPEGGIIWVNLSNLPDWLDVDSMTAEIAVLPPLPEEQPETNETDNETEEIVYTEPTVTCEVISLPDLDPGSAKSNMCTLANPNDFSITIDWDSTSDWIESAVLNISVQPASLSVAKASSENFALRFEWTGDVEDMESGDHSMNMTGVLHHHDKTLAFSSDIVWTLVEEVGETNTGEDPTDGGDGGDGGGGDDAGLDDNVSAGGDSKFLTYAMYAGGGIIALGVLVVIGTMLIGGRNEFDDDDDDDEDDDWEDSFSTFDDDAPSASKALSRVNRPDTVKFQERRNKPEPEPEPEPEEYYTDDEYQQQEDWEGEADADGVTVDEDGTEWWEDDDGTWWYRTPEMEDWVVFEE